MEDLFREESEKTDKEVERESEDAWHAVIFGLIAGGIFSAYFRQGASRVNELMSSRRASFNEHVMFMGEANTRIATNHAWSVSHSSNPRDSISVINGYIESQLANLRSLPDPWGLTYAQRSNAHYDRFLRRIVGYSANTSRHYRSAEIGVSKLSSVRDRGTFLREMNLIERDGRASLIYSPTHLGKFRATTKLIREWAKDHPDEVVPKRMRDNLRSIIDSGVRASFERRLSQLAGIFKSDMVKLDRNYSHRIFFEATEYFISRHPETEAIKWNLNPAHPKPDICDTLAGNDMGLGAGVYYVGYVPMIPHPNCGCFTSPVYRRFGGRQYPPNPGEARALIEEFNNADPRG
jgi:hypothetical protein